LGIELTFWAISHERIVEPTLCAKCPFVHKVPD
jgi:hypothetical protein